MPQYDNATAKRFSQFARLLISRAFKPLTVSQLKSTEEWLSVANYSSARKAQFWAMRQWSSMLGPKDLEADSFGKGESYDEMKNARPINSYSDKFKAEFGAYCHSIDKVIFSHPAFVKQISIDERPRKLYDLFGDRPVMAGDYTSFEAHHHGVFAELDYWVQCYLAQDLPRAQEYLGALKELMLGTNTCKFDRVTVSVDQRLMSGAFWTSSSNTLLNLCLSLFLAAETRMPRSPVAELVRFAEGVAIVVEGDDSLSDDYPIEQDLLDKLGVRLKFARFPNFGPASFCGIKVDVNSMQNMTDPRKVLVELGAFDPWWAGATNKKLLELLKCKGLSILACYPACPIVTEIGLYALRVTNNVSASKAVRHVSAYKESMFKTRWYDLVTASDITPQTRATFHSYFGIDVSRQLEIEETLRRCNDIYLPFIDLDFPSAWHEYASRYCLDASIKVAGEWYPKNFEVNVVAPSKQVQRKRVTLPSWTEPVSMGPDLLRFMDVDIYSAKFSSRDPNARLRR